MKTVILAGGFGTRLSEETVIKPKPMVEIGGKPILWHIMKIYESHGFREFVLALGYKGEYIKRYFLDYTALNSNLTLDLARGNSSRHNGATEEWIVHLWDTGLQTHTGGRVKRLKEVIGDETFMMTYGDGVSTVNLRELLAFHREHGKLATLTAVRPPARYGSLRIDGGTITRFSEKDPAGEAWVNGGFFVVEPEVIDWVDDDETEWESGVLEKLAAEGQLMAYRHEGFWQSMDTLRDVRGLNDLWEQGQAPWKLW